MANRFMIGMLVLTVIMAMVTMESGWLILGLVFLVSYGVLSWLRRQRSMERVRVSIDPSMGHRDSDWKEARGWLRRWLYLAGYRRRTAPWLFIGATLLLSAMGGAFAYALEHLRIVDWMIQPLRMIPGGMGEAFVAVASVSPWIVLLLFGTTPLLMVRAARRDRVSEVEQDLPLFLDLMATLTEGGHSFDAALEKILVAHDRPRLLLREFRQFQRELMMGIARVQAFRRLAHRLDVTSLSLFISGLIQSEQIGSSLAATLRRQADDLRNRRREQALMLAQAMPVKLVFPLVACFLPGIFIATLGPTLYQLVGVVGSIFVGNR